MKKILKLAFLTAAIVSLSSCEKTNGTPEPWLEVTTNNISGTWMLSEWNGNAQGDGTYVYIELTRRDKTFTIYQNTDSFSARKITGRYNLETDSELGTIIRGLYDYGNGDWNHRYIVRNLTKESMTWVATDDQNNVSVYRRCEAVPDDILSQFPSDED